MLSSFRCSGTTKTYRWCHWFSPGSIFISTTKIKVWTGLAIRYLALNLMTIDIRESENNDIQGALSFHPIIISSHYILSSSFRPILTFKPFALTLTAPSPLWSHPEVSGTKWMRENVMGWNDCGTRCMTTDIQHARIGSESNESKSCSSGLKLSQSELMYWLNPLDWTVRVSKI